MFSTSYNKRKPPKQIDIMQICIIKINNYKEDSKETLFQMEHFIDGM